MLYVAVPRGLGVDASALAGHVGANEGVKTDLTMHNVGLPNDLMAGVEPLPTASGLPSEVTSADVGAQRALRVPVLVHRGATLTWRFALHAKDLGFKLLARKMGDGGAVEVRSSVYLVRRRHRRACLL